MDSMETNKNGNMDLPEVTYPITVKYCGHCSMPIEYCEYYSEYDKCKEWLAQNYPEDYEALQLKEAQNAASLETNDAEKKRQKRGGKGMLRIKKETPDDAPKRICLSCVTRAKNKRVTIIAGLGAYKIDLRAATKFLGAKFACGCSITNESEIVIQGDVKDELVNIIPLKWPEVSSDVIEDCGDGKKAQQNEYKQAKM